MRDLKKYLVDGQVSETRSFLRWEDPALSQNGEGRISPTIPGCQTTITVIGKDGNALLQNHIFKIPDVEGAGKEGQNAIDMAPIQPHTIQKKPRSCESCHSTPKAMGFGITGSKTTKDPSVNTIIDIMSADGKVMPTIIDEQIPAIKNLHFDYSKFLDENGTQLQTVGHHWSLSQPLSKEQRNKVDRRGVCLACHQNIPEGTLAISAMSHIANMAQVNIDKKMHENILNKTLHVSAWTQVGGTVLLVLFLIYILFFKKSKERRWR
jgi:hypothetical protein